MIEGACPSSDCSIEIGSIQTFSALMFFSNGTTQAREAVWVSENADVATVDAAGNVRAISTGTATIRATAGSMTAARAVRVVAPRLGSWRGEAVITRCVPTGRFDSWWCDELYRIGGRMTFGLNLREHNGRVSGGVSIDRSGGGLSIDEGSTLDADGRLQLSARGEGGLGFLGPFWAIVDPLTAQVRGASVDGRFVMTIIGQPGSGFDGSVVVEATLDGVSRQ